MQFKFVGKLISLIEIDKDISELAHYFEELVIRLTFEQRLHVSCELLVEKSLKAITSLLKLFTQLFRLNFLLRIDPLKEDVTVHPKKLK